MPQHAGEFFFKKIPQQSPIILGLFLRKTRAWKSRDYRAVMVFEKLRFQNAFRPH